MTLRTLCVALALSAASYAMPGYAQEESEGPVTASQVIDWIYAYSDYYGYPAQTALRVARCESAGFDVAVINGWRLGRAGEVGTFQFHPRGIWWATPQAKLGFSRYNPEENVAAGVWGLSHGLAKHWTCY